LEPSRRVEVDEGMDELRHFLDTSKTLPCSRVEVDEGMDELRTTGADSMLLIAKPNSLLIFNYS